MIRVLTLIATLDPAGAERQLAELCARIDRAQFEPFVCCLTRGGPLESVLADARVPVAILHKRGKWDISVIFRLRRIFAEFKPQILHTWLPTANTIGRIAACGGHLPAVIASERAADIWKGFFRRWLDRRLELRTARIICNAEAVRAFLINRIGLHAHKITVIPNGLDLDEFDAAAKPPCAALPARPPGPLLGAVGRLEPQKGITHLLTAMALLGQSVPDAQLWIIGDGPERAALSKQAADAGLDNRVHFLGRRNDVPAILRQLDLFVLPSLWEGLPNAALEAMAAGRAVVATRVHGTPEAVSENETGLLVPPADPVALADAIARLIADSNLCARMGAAGRSRVAEHFNMRQMVEQTQALYRQVLGGDVTP